MGAIDILVGPLGRRSMDEKTAETFKSLPTITRTFETCDPLRESVERWSKVKHGAPRPEATYTGPERRQRQSAATETPVQ